jgi:hypothetical protein
MSNICIFNSLLAIDTHLQAVQAVICTKTPIFSPISAYKTLISV